MGFVCVLFLKLLLLKIIVSMKKGYVDVWGWVKICGVCMCTFLKLLLLKIIVSMKEGYVDV